MLVIRQRIAPALMWQAELELTYDARSKSRLRCFSSSGGTSACFSNAASRRSPTVSACWQPMAVWCACAPPNSCCVTCASAFELTRAAYHLGNRHVALQVGDGWLRLLDDYVLRTCCCSWAPRSAQRRPSSRSMAPTVAVIIPTPARRSSVRTAPAPVRRTPVNATGVRPGLGLLRLASPLPIGGWLFPGAGDGGGERPGERPGQRPALAGESTAAQPRPLRGAAAARALPSGGTGRLAAPVASGCRTPRQPRNPRAAAGNRQMGYSLAQLLDGLPELDQPGRDCLAADEPRLPGLAARAWRSNPPMHWPPGCGAGWKISWRC